MTGDQAVRHLVAADPAWLVLIDRVGPCGLSHESGRTPYEALMRAIAYQQIHGRAAEAILGRFLAHFAQAGESGFPSPRAVLAADPEVLRACGFSARKVLTLRGIAEGSVRGLVPGLDEAAALSDDELVARLVTLSGVGRWTVEMLLIFTLGRPDVLPVDDFGVREGWRVLKGLDEQPKPRALAAVGQDWRPYRSTAAWYLWRAADLARAGWRPTAA